MAKELHVLLYNDASSVGVQALELGRRIALTMASEVDILAIPRDPEDAGRVNRTIEEVATELRAADTLVTVLQRPGHMDEEVVRQACSKPYDLIVIGSEGRRGLKRLVIGSRACDVVGHTVTSILVVKGRRRKTIDNMLVCSAAGSTSDETIRFAGKVARALGASVTLLHVMSQVALERDAHMVDLAAKAEDLMESEAREGAHLDRMLDILREEGGEARAIVRHGSVVEEITAQAQKGSFDILAIGAHTTSGIGSLLVDDLTEKIMLAANRPVLVVQQAPQERVDEHGDPLCDP